MERIMRAAAGLLSVVIALAAGYWFYMSNMKTSGASSAPAQVVSTVGVQGDLLSLAQAERVYQAGHGSYASLDELYSSGTLTARRASREGYTYSSEISLDGFTITARCQLSPQCPSFSIDQNMQVQQLP
jgi:hypothetical protein